MKIAKIKALMGRREQVDETQREIYAKDEQPLRTLSSNSTEMGRGEGRGQGEIQRHYQTSHPFNPSTPKSD